MGNCTWPSGSCACLMAQQEKPEDRAGRVWMHCEEGLSFSKSSMSRFVMFCLSQGVEIGDLYAFNPRFPRSLVVATVRLRPNQFEAFERETGGKLRKPPQIKLNTTEVGKREAGDG